MEMLLEILQVLQDFADYYRNGLNKCTELTLLFEQWSFLFLTEKNMLIETVEIL